MESVSDAKFVMIIHGAIIVALVVAITILRVTHNADSGLTAAIFGGALGYAGGRTMNTARNGNP